MAVIILYYRYIPIEDPKLIVDWQRELCNKLDLKGRIIVAHEGINGTLAGSESNIMLYKQAMSAHPLFNAIDFKESIGSLNDFPRMRIVIKDEIVRLGLDSRQYKATDGATHLTPEQAHAAISNTKNLVLFDARNNYESKIGTFAGAVTPDIKTFRELPAFIDNNIDLFRDKEVLMFCTGGVRCERASAYLKSKDVARKVYQLEGGIHRYLEQFPDGFFRGKNFVFDGRIAMTANDDVIAQCEYCAKPCDNYSHCSLGHCHELTLLCNACKKIHSGFCPTCSNTSKTASHATEKPTSCLI